MATPLPAIVGKLLSDAGLPVEGAVVSLSGDQTRRTITDSYGNYRFDGLTAASSYTVTPARANFNFNPYNRSLTQINTQTEADFVAAPMNESSNPLDTPEYFVRQQYLDILGREPDEDGFNYWSNQILACGADETCKRTQRITIAAAFFIEQEAQQTASFIYGMYAASVGRAPGFAEYRSDRGQVIGGTNLAAAKRSFSENFVQRPEFVSRYQNAQTSEAFVDALLNSARSSGADLTSERLNLIGIYQSSNVQTQSRASVLRAVADNASLQQSFYNRAFVLTEYFAYLRRDVDQSGYDFWVNVLNNGDPNNYRGMVCSFTTSTEYQKRFGTIVGHSNSECGP
jgi:hypothetical protein